MNIRSLIAFLLLLFSTAVPKAENYTFNHYVKPSLYKERVTNICSDKYGLIWYTSTPGVYRVDKFGSKRYFVKDENQNKITVEIHQFFNDNNGEVYIANSFNLYRFDYVSNSFRRIKEFGESTKIVLDDNKRYYYFNEHGLFTSESKKILDSTINFNGENIVVTAVHWMNDKQISFEADQGIYIWDRSSSKVVANFLKPEYVNSVIRYENQLCIVGFNQFSVYENDKLKKIIETPTKDRILRTFLVNNKLWISYDNNMGVFTYDFISGKFEKVYINTKYEEVDRISIMSIYYNYGVIWLGSVWNGIFYVEINSVYQIYNKSLTKKSLSLNRIPTLLVDKDNRLYIGTDGKGLNELSPDRKQVLKHEMNISFVSILNFDKEHLLLGSYEKGLYTFNKKTKQYRAIFNKGNFWSLIRLDKNRILVCGDEVFEMDNNFKVLHSYNIDHNNYLSVVKKDGKVYLGGHWTLGVIDYVNQTVVQNMGIPGRVYDIQIKNDDYLWLATSSGLLNYNTKSDKWEKGDGLLSNIPVFSICRDSSMTWFGTNGGIFSYDKQKDEFLNQNFGKVISVKRSSSVVDNSGVVFMGGNNGLLSFDPKVIDKRDKHTEIIFTDFVINTEYSSHKLIDNKDINEIDYVELEYNQSSFTLKFSQNDFGEKVEKDIFYEFEPEVNEWKVLNNNSITFHSLKKGKYSLKIKVGDESKIKVLNIVVLSAWWDTVWARVIFVLLFLVMVAYFVFLILNKRNKQIEIEKKLKEEELYKEKFRYFTNISHEIRTPLTLIKSPLNSISNGVKNYNYEIDIINENVDRLNRLVDTVLNIQKIDFDINDLKYSKTNIVKFVNKTIKKYKHFSDAKRIKLSVLNKFDTINIWFDQEKMGMILNNLITNAIKYSNEAGMVTIKVENHKSNVLISVIDNGIGIKKENLANIFKRFFQDNEGRGGAGVGLSIVHHFVEAHGGNIHVESEYGKGSTFIISLLKGDAHIDKTKKVEIEDEEDEIVSKPEQKEDTINIIPEVTNKKLLLVEDDIELGDYLYKCFAPYYKTTLLNNGAKAIEFLKKNSVDIVISDVMLPELTGTEICTFIKNDAELSRIPILLLTGKSKTSEIVEGYRHGADAYLTKPFDLDILYSMVDNLVNNRSVLKDSYLRDLKLTEKDIDISKDDENFLNKSIELIEENIANADFDVNEFISEIGHGRTVAYRKIKALTGQGIKDFILTIRLKKAAALLIHTKMPIVEIAESVGVPNSQYFSTLFKKYFNVTPTKYRQSKHKA
jgi:signal transduction histidine kinase/DNA-binding response OmpR family regulator/ligand-binding sensor domain-containing protein